MAQVKRVGCQCHFSVTVYWHDEGTACITYYQTEHINKEGHICHGPAYITVDSSQTMMQKSA
jgi:hypothetical protein